MSLPPIVHKGSVKNIRGDASFPGLIFEFSDRYSVFDWGEMPDVLEGKGQSLAVCAGLLFKIFSDKETWKKWTVPPTITSRPSVMKIYRQLCERGLRSHYIGQVDENLQTLPEGSLSRCLCVKSVDVLRPFQTSTGPDYSCYQSRPVNALVPLEIIFRFGVPEGNSLIDRLFKKTSSLKDLGLERIPIAGELFESPIVEFSTKLESTDRYLSYMEAANIAGLNAAEFDALVACTLLLAARLRTLFDKMEVELWDGKFEFAFVEGANGIRDFMLVDAIGPDELRILKNGAHLSKEIFRQFYSGSKWHETLKKAKELAQERGIIDWKRLVIEEFGMMPDQLSPEVKHRGENIYKAIANHICCEADLAKVFPDVPDLHELLRHL